MTNSNIKVAFADDNLIVRRLLRSIVKGEEDMQLVGEADNGADIVSIIRDRKPDVVIIDIIMSKMDGIDVIRKIKVDKSVKKIPVFIAISAVGDDRITKEAFAAGAKYYILKPIEKDVLVEKIHWALAKEHERKAQEQNGTGRYSETEVNIVNLLLQLGMPVHIIGHKFMRDALTMVIEDRDSINSITKLLYPDIARKNKTTSARVERAMRHAIEVVWTKGDLVLLSDIFGRTAGNIAERPTNSEFIARLVEYMTIHSLT